jgi:PKD repeat protein
MYLWTTGEEAEGPLAAFDHTRSGTVGGQVSFSSTSTNPTGQILTHQWDFGDGETSNVVAPTHVYTRPGTYPVRLTVTDQNGRSNTRTEQVEVIAPPLGVAVHLPDGGGVEVGAEFDVEVRLIAPVSVGGIATLGQLTDVRAVGDDILRTPEHIEIVESPEQLLDGELPDEGLVLEPGAGPTVLTWKVRATTPGRFTLRSTWQARDAAGRALDPVEAEASGQAGSIPVDVVADPNPVELEVADGETEPTPEDVTVTVTITNPFDEALEDVELDVLQPSNLRRTPMPPGYRPFRYTAVDGAPVDDDGTVVHQPDVGDDDPDGEPADGGTGDDDPADGDEDGDGAAPGGPEEPGDDLDGGAPAPSLRQIALDPIPAGESIEVQLDGVATGAADLRLRTLVSGVVRAEGEQDGDALWGVGNERLQIASDLEFVFDAEVDPADVTSGGVGPDAAGLVQGGAEWRVRGTMSNRSAEHRLEVTLVPELEANAAYGVPIPLGESAADPECGIGITRTLDPLEELEFTSPVRTSADGSPRSRIRFDPQVRRITSDGLEPLRAEQMIITDGSDDHRVVVEVRDPVPEWTIGGVVYNFSGGTLEGLSNLLNGIGDLGYMAANAIELGLSPWAWPEALQSGLLGASEYLALVYDNLEPEDRATWDTNVVAAAQMALGYTAEQATSLVDGAVRGWFEDVSTAYYQGDIESVARTFGRLAGENPDLVAQAMVTGYAACKLAHRSSLGAQRALLGVETSAARAAEDAVARAARDLVDGTPLNYEDHARGIFGVDRALDERLLEHARQTGTTIFLRRRGVSGADKVESGRYVGKPYPMKAKNGSPIDDDYLGFRGWFNGQVLGVIDEVAIKQPPPWSAVQSRLNANLADADEVALVRARWQKRWDEWYGKGAHPETGAGGDLARSERALWQRWTTDGMPYPRKDVGVDYRDNIARGRATPSDDAMYVRIPFRIRTMTAVDGREMWVPEVRKPGETWKRVTGDMDPMGSVTPDHRMLPEDARLAMYKEWLELGLEHPDSMYWNDVAGRNAYLWEFSTQNAGSEAMIAYTPWGTRKAVRFDTGKSWFDPADHKNAGMLVLRGANVALHSGEPAVSPAPPGADDRSGYVSPAAQHLLGDCEDGDSSLAALYPDLVAPGPGDGTDPGDGVSVLGVGCGAAPVEFRRDDDTPVLRNNPDADDPDRPWEIWDEANGWTPHEVSDGEPLAMLPQTATSVDAAAGEGRVEIFDLADLGLDPGGAFFAVGDRIVLDPGGEREELATISGFGSLLLEQPLRYSHPAGTMVSVVSPADAATDTPPITVPPSPTTPPETTPAPPPGGGPDGGQVAPGGAAPEAGAGGPVGGDPATPAPASEQVSAGASVSGSASGSASGSSERGRGLAWTGGGALSGVLALLATASAVLGALMWWFSGRRRARPLQR